MVKHVGSAFFASERHHASAVSSLLLAIVLHTGGTAGPSRLLTYGKEANAARRNIRFS